MAADNGAVNGSAQARGPARLAIVGLFIAATVAIVLIMDSGAFEDASARALSAVVTIALFSLVGKAGYDLLNGPPSLAYALGLVTIVVCVVALIAVVTAVWSGGLFSDEFRTAGMLTILAMGMGQASLIVGSLREDDGRLTVLVVLTSLALLAALCTAAIVEVSSQGRDVSLQTLAVVSVLYLLGALLPPLLRRADIPDL